MNPAERPNTKSCRIRTLNQQFDLGSTVASLIYLVHRSSLLRQRHRRRDAHCQMITTHIIHSAFLDHGPYPWLLQMLNLILIRRRQMRTHRALMTRDNNATLPRRFLLVDPVLNMDALLFAFLA